MIIDLARQIKCRLNSRAAINPRFFNIRTDMTREELIRLYKLAASCSREAVIVEVGSYLGASTCFLAAGALSKAGKVHAVDTWDNLAMSEGPRDTFDEFSRNTELQKEHIIALRGLSHNVANRFTEKINLLFIDGDHSYEGCLLDWTSWNPLLGKKSIVVFHDIGWAEGVQRVVREEVAPRAKKQGRLHNLYWAWL